MKLINADMVVHWEAYDDEHESFTRHSGTIAEFLDQMTDEGCPEMVDAVPVVRGEWIEENTRPRSGVFYCSSCHRTCYDIQPTRLKGWTKRCRYAFCPNCGADMRKDGEHG